jgi:hypothetical protein
MLKKFAKTKNLFAMSKYKRPRIKIKSVKVFTTITLDKSKVLTIEQTI